MSAEFQFLRQEGGRKGNTKPSLKLILVRHVQRSIQTDVRPLCFCFTVGPKPSASPWDALQLSSIPHQIHPLLFFFKIPRTFFSKPFMSCFPGQTLVEKGQTPLTPAPRTRMCARQTRTVVGHVQHSDTCLLETQLIQKVVLVETCSCLLHLFVRRTLFPKTVSRCRLFVRIHCM